MNLSSALANAVSGLGAAAQSTTVISDNLANAATGGFRAREVQLATQVGPGAGGVAVAGVQRVIDAAILGQRRLADASLAAAGVATGFATRFESLLGLPGAPGGLSGRLDAFEAALTDAASRPDLAQRLAAVAEAGRGLAEGFNAVAKGIAAERASADAAIARDVSLVNGGLARIADLNRAIQRLEAAGQDSNALRDTRDREIDAIAPIVPLRVTERAGGGVALFTEGGAVLLDLEPAILGFTPSRSFGADARFEEGTLGGITLDGRPVAAGPGGAFDGGRLAANFALRDVTAPAALDALDMLAADLVARFAEPALDATLAPGEAGLFAARGSTLLPATRGLAAQLEFAPRADPALGGDAELLRDGLNATTPGPSGNASLLAGALDALARPGEIMNAAFSGQTAGFAGLAATFIAGAVSARGSAEAGQSAAAAGQAALAVADAASGVNSDAELQRLLLVERVFAANARVIQAVDEMLQQIERI